MWTKTAVNDGGTENEWIKVQPWKIKRLALQGKKIQIP